MYQKADSLNPDIDNLSVRLAVAETRLTMEAERFLKEGDINVSAFGKRSGVTQSSISRTSLAVPQSRSIKNCLVHVENLGRMPPAKTIVIIKFLPPGKAGSAFSHLAYKRFKDCFIPRESA
jgi:multiple RNA-binding domain-containing protein 1